MRELGVSEIRCVCGGVSEKEAMDRGNRDLRKLASNVCILGTRERLLLVFLTIS